MTTNQKMGQGERCRQERGGCTSLGPIITQLAHGTCPKRTQESNENLQQHSVAEWRMTAQEGITEEMDFS